MREPNSRNGATHPRAVDLGVAFGPLVREVRAPGVLIAPMTWSRSHGRLNTRAPGRTVGESCTGEKEEAASNGPAWGRRSGGALLAVLAESTTAGRFARGDAGHYQVGRSRRNDEARREPDTVGSARSRQSARAVISGHAGDTMVQSRSEARQGRAGTASGNCHARSILALERSAQGRGHDHDSQAVPGTPADPALDRRSERSFEPSQCDLSRCGAPDLN